VSKRWRCTECDWVGPERDLLVAPNPFEPQFEVCGCPECRDIDCFHLLCDEPGCEEDGTCGWPTPTGYRHTCSKHSKHA
jgi:hypothetical protein